MMEITSEGHSIIVKSDDGSTLSESSVTTILLFKMLELLQEIKDGLVDVESAINPR
jgi:L-asparaginase II